MIKSVFSISKMDCPSEENLIRMKLASIEGIENLEFDISNRVLTIYHINTVQPIQNSLNELNLGSSLIDSQSIDKVVFSKENKQQKILWQVLLINLSFFIIEVVFGWISYSMGLVADSLDMLADSFVYGLSLFAIGGSVLLQKRIAKIAGFAQILLAIIGFFEVIKRFLFNQAIPDFKTMVIVSLFALFANAWCLILLQKAKSKEAHMQASMIFTSNDIIINIGVILAAIFVKITASNIPDLLIGTIVFILVLQGAFRILKLAR